MESGAGSVAQGGNLASRANGVARKFGTKCPFLARLFWRPGPIFDTFGAPSALPSHRRLVRMALTTPRYVAAWAGACPVLSPSIYHLHTSLKIAHSDCSARPSNSMSSLTHSPPSFLAPTFRPTTSMSAQLHDSSRQGFHVRIRTGCAARVPPPE